MSNSLRSQVIHIYIAYHLTRLNIVGKTFPWLYHSNILGHLMIRTGLGLYLSDSDRVEEA